MELNIKITNDDGRITTIMEKAFGNLWIKGPWICSGYLNISHSETHDNNGWFMTGDVATIDQGWIYANYR